MEKLKLFDNFIAEASRRKVHKAAKQGSYPAVIVVVQDGEVIHQEPVSTPDIAPATFNVMQEKYPKALLHLEDITGKRLFTESVVTESEAENILDDLLDERGGDMEELHGMEMEDALDTVGAYGHKGSKAKKIAQELHSLCNESLVTESKKSEALGKAIEKAMIKIDDSMSYEDFALAVGQILRDEYGQHNFMPFMKVLHKDLGI